MIIVSAEVGASPRASTRGIFDELPSVTVEFDNGTKRRLFTYDPTAMTFHPYEFVGLTEREAYLLRERKAGRRKR